MSDNHRSLAYRAGEMSRSAARFAGKFGYWAMFAFWLCLILLVVFAAVSGPFR